VSTRDARPCPNYAITATCVAARASGEHFKIAFVVRTHDSHVLAAVLQLPQPALIIEARTTIVFHHPLVDTQTGRASRVLTVHFMLVEIGVGGRGARVGARPVFSRYFRR
jgi:hypothetical protein